MPSKRARDAESRVRLQVVKWTAEGAVKRIFPEYSATQDMRKLSGIC